MPPSVSSSSDVSSDDTSSTSSSSSSSSVKLTSIKHAPKAAPKKVPPKAIGSVKTAAPPGAGLGPMRVKSASGPSKLPPQPSRVFRQNPRERKAKIHNTIELKRHRDLCEDPASLDVVKKQVAWVCNREFRVRPGRVNTRELARIVMRTAAYSPDSAVEEIFPFLHNVLDKTMTGSIAHGEGASLSIFLLSAKLLIGLSLWLTRFLESDTLGRIEWMKACLTIAKRVLTATDISVMTPELWGTFPILMLKVIAQKKELQPICHTMLEMVVPWVGIKQPEVETPQPVAPLDSIDVAAQLQNERRSMAVRLQKTQNTLPDDTKSLPAIIVVDEEDKKEAVITAAAPRRLSNSYTRKPVVQPPPSYVTTPPHARKLPISTKPVVSILNKTSSGNRIVWDSDVKDTFGPSKYRNQDSRRERETRNTDKVKLRIKLSELAELEEGCLRSSPVEGGVWTGWQQADEVTRSEGPLLPGFRHESFNCIHRDGWAGTPFQYLPSEIDAESNELRSVPTPPPTTTLVKIPVKPRRKPIPKIAPATEECIDLTEI